MSPPRNWIMPTIYFKVVFTDNTRSYQVDPNWSLDDFWNITKSRIIRDFNIDQYELVEAGQNVNNGLAEQGIAFDKNEPVRLCEKYGRNVNVSFYIRPLNIFHTFQQEEIVEELPECAVCYNNIQLICPYICNHIICSNCYASCLNNSFLICPMCRGQPL
jgi:hypothetical protein